MSGLLEGKSGLVTGGASGIGRACAVRFAREGAAVVVADLPGAADGAQETIAAIAADGGRAEFFACDVSRSDDNEALVAFVVQRYGRLDFAHNNAGIGVHRPLHETSDEDFDRVIAVNLRGTFLGMKHQIRAMLTNDMPNRGAIVNTSSNAGLLAVTMLSAYAASKHGILGLTKNGAVEYADEGIRVNAVCPGPIDTPMLAAEFATWSDPHEARRSELATIPLNRLGAPADIAAIVSFLASDAAAFVTGAAWSADGGKTAR
jgi:NAD(P)-dependent dehydrogenase (short-subunit alcohol dehydrogenase family)